MMKLRENVLPILSSVVPDKMYSSSKSFGKPLRCDISNYSDLQDAMVSAVEIAEIKQNIDNSDDDDAGGHQDSPDEPHEGASH